MWRVHGLYHPEMVLKIGWQSGAHVPLVLWRIFARGQGFQVKLY